jgi:uncharacterized protein
MQTIEHTMIWRRLDLPGLDAAYYGPTRSGWRLCGTAIFASQTGPCHLGYAVDADECWRTRSAHVFGTVGDAIVDVHIGASADRGWTVGRRARPDVAECIDLDLGFTTAPRLFTLRRLALLDGQEGVAPVAQLHLPDFELGPVTESYLRMHRSAFRFSSTAGGPSTIINVDAHQVVVRYPGRWDSDAFAAVDTVAALHASRPNYRTTPPANAEALRAAKPSRVLG